MPTSQIFILILWKEREGPEADEGISSGFGLTSILIKPFQSRLEFSLNSVPEPEGMQSTDKGRGGIRIGIWI